MSEIVYVIKTDRSQYDRELQQIESDAVKSGEKVAKNFDSGIESASDGKAVERLKKTTTTSLDSISSAITKVTLGTAGLAAGFYALSRGSMVLSFFKDIFSYLGKSSQSLYGFTSNVSLAGGALTTFGYLATQSSNEVLQAIGLITAGVGGLYAAIGVGIAYAILKVSEFARNLGDDLVGRFDGLSKSFVKLDGSTKILAATIGAFNRETGGALGETDQWTAKIIELSKQLNFTRDSLSKASVEIVSVGSRLGLNRSQIEKLIDVSAAYAKINQKDVYDSAVAFSSALNGNTQSVINYGVKLGDANLQQYIYKQGIDQTVDSMSEYDKSQARFNLLLAQYSTVAGVATTASETLADQQNRLLVIQEKFNTELGRGAAIIENNNILISAANTALGVFSDTSLQVFGFLGALGSRFLQVGGYVLEFSFKIFTLLKVMKLLDVALKTDLIQSAFAKNIPFLSGSINQFAQSLAGTTVQLTSLKGFGKALRDIIFNQLGVLAGVTTQSGRSVLSLGNIFVLIFQRMTTSVLAFGQTFLTLLAPLAPFIVTIGLIVGAVILFVEAFKALDEKTGVITAVVEIATSAFNDLKESLLGTDSVLGAIFTTIKDIASRGFGLLVFAISKVFEVLSALAQKNPFNLFSKQTIEKISSLNSKMATFNKDLVAANFNMAAIGTTASESLDGVNKTITTNLESLAQLRRDLANIGVPEVTIIQQEMNARLAMVNTALNEELLSEQAAADLRNKIRTDANAKTLKAVQEFNEAQKREFESYKEATMAGNQQIGLSFETLWASLKEKATDLKITYAQAATAIFDTIVNVQVAFFEALGQSLAKGEDGFNNFGQKFAELVGGLAIQIGSLLIAAGTAALVSPFAAAFIGNGAALIAAGGAMVTLGAAFKAANGAGGFSSGIESGGGIAGGVSPVTENPVTNDPDARREPDTNVNVVINGDVLDSDETSIRIVDLLNEAFDKKGVKIRRTALA